ncbi:hypothetical protein A9G06_17115 [Aeromonas sp. DNP9]|nr:hypothetical protein A9G06_17115 [Aeromonas sp. DNP9]
MPILPPLPQPQRRRIHKIIHATRDKGHARLLMAIKINRLTGLNVAASTLRRWLHRMGIVWHRPVPTLRIKDPAYQEKMANIDAALARVKHFMDTVSPFRGNGYGTAKV